MTKAQRDIKRKLRVLNYAKEIGNVSKACRYFGISRETFHLWKRAYEQHGDKPYNPINTTFDYSSLLSY